jgi:hypothetical protein
MKLPPLRKHTDATVYHCHMTAADGRVHVLVLVKQRFKVTLAGVVKRTPGAEPRLRDELWDEEKPEQSSIKLASDLCLRKPAADILVKGAAMSRGRARQSEIDVLVRVGGVSRTLRVFGTRVWYKGAFGLTMTPPEPFESQELKWESAFGGRDASTGKLLEESRNPVGKGFVARPAMLVNQPLPNIEDPADLITGEKSRPKPAGVAPIMHHWEPRKTYAGSYDDAWLRERVPLPPLDFDERHNQCAPPELVYPGHLRGGEQVDVFNMCEEGALRFALPKLSFFVGAHMPEGLVEHRPVLDTLLLEPNDLSFELVYRASIPMPPRAHEIRAVQVHERKVLS